MENEHIIVEKSKLAEDIWERVEAVLKSRKVSQLKLEELCLEHGFQVKQPEISRLYSKKAHITLYQIMAFSEVLDVPVEQFLYQDKVAMGFQFAGGSLISDPSDDVFSGYIGNYEVMLHSTTPFENKLLFGKLMFTPDERQKRCVARFYLDTGEKTGKGQPIYKKYEGILLISQKLSACYVLLINEQIGEVSMIVFRHRAMLVKRMECRLGMALTVSAGESRTPVAQKLWISRKKITDEMVEKISPFLRMEPINEVLLKKEDLLEWKENEKNQSIHIDEAMLDEFVNVSELMIRYCNKKMSRGQIAGCFASLKSRSSASYISAVTEQDDNLIYELFKTAQEKIFGDVI